MKQSDRILRIDLLGGAVMLALVGGAVGLGVWPAYSAVDERRERVQAKATMTAEIDRVSGETEARRSRITDLERRLEAVEFVPLAVSHQNRRIADLLDHAAASGVTVDQIEPGQASSDPYGTRVPLAIRGTAGSGEVLSWLELVRASAPDIGLAGAVISARAGDGLGSENTRGSAGLCDFRIDLVWFAASED